MKLLSLKLSGFRRFQDEVSIRLSEKLIAVVGPNEAGKSSFLDALQYLGRDEPIPTKDTTRRQRVTAEIEACFEVEDSEREDLLKEIPGGRGIRRLILSVSSEAEGRILLEPEPPEKLKLREKSRLAFEDCGFAPYIRDGNSREKETKQEALDHCGTILRLEDSYLDLDEIAHLKKVEKNLRTFSAVNPLGNQELNKFVELLESLVSEEENNPPRKARDILMPQIPEFIFFDDAARELRNTYRLSEHGNDPPPALLNLCGLANLDLEELLEASASKDSSWISEIQEKANIELKNRMSQAWIRSDVVPELRIDGDELQILVTAPDNAGKSMVDERSDGLRWFLALLGLLYSRKSSVKPILLVDEAEQHLSYDAQASLINVLETQDVVQKVIYTTHSAGCLPSDLGTGIRPVVPLAGQRSTIKNCFWQESPGFSPLLMAMGLGPLAFTVARNELIGEGASECLLLPSLLREATGRTFLGFQVAPGASTVSKSYLHDLAAESGRSLFILDGDRGGQELKNKFLESGIESQRVRTLSDFTQNEREMAIEDLVLSSALADAVNQQLSQWQSANDRISETDLPRCGRWQALGEWCDVHDVKVPSKTTICQALAEFSAVGTPIVDKDAKQLLMSLYTWAAEHFNIVQQS